MRPIEFPQANIIIAKDQPEYQPLPAHRTKDGVVTSAWELQPEDFKRLLARPQGAPALVYVSQLTFGRPLQPLLVATQFAPPTIPDAVNPAVPAKPEAEGAQQNEADGEVKPKNQGHLAGIAKCLGLSGPILFAMDSESTPGKCVCHFVRMETQVFDEGAEAPSMTQLGPDADPRLPHLADCFTGPMVKGQLEMLQVLKLNLVVAQALLKLNSQPPKLRQALQNTIKATATCIDQHGGT